MPAPAHLDEAIRRSIDLFPTRVRARYPVAEAWLYGSRARGDARADSDVDIAVVLDEPKRRTSPVAADFGGDGFDVLVDGDDAAASLTAAREFIATLVERFPTKDD